MIARIVLAPLEETIGVYFSQNMKRSIPIDRQDKVFTHTYIDIFRYFKGEDD